MGHPPSREPETSCWSWCASAPKPPPKEPKELPSVLRKIEKWGDYEAVGGVIRVKGNGSGIIPMKTPLTVAQMRKLTAGGKRVVHPHTLRAFVDAQGALGRRVGLIVDLTQHDCLYAEELAQTPWVRYVHLATPAKRFVEPWLVAKLADEARDLWTADPGAFVAVHCSYGFNRTGFVLASYLCEVDGLDVDDALARFRESRPPGVKHGHFEEELRRRYPSRRASAPSPIPTGENGRHARNASMDDSEPASLSTTPQQVDYADPSALPLLRCAAARATKSPLRRNAAR